MAGDEQLVRIDGRRLRLTNLGKVLYPATGTTKGEVVDYYARIAGLLIPHVTGRAVTRKRWPEGVDHPPFFAKDLEPGSPSWVPREPIDHSGGAKLYPIVRDRATLAYLAQVASLELHVPQWRFAPGGGRENPDRLVLDLDPGEGVGLAACAEVARRARGILHGMGLDPMPVTSGSKGIHLYAALDGRQTSDQVSAVARELARALEADDPDLIVSQMRKSIRPGKVFIDWSQNNGSKTTIAPYSLRGRETPTVAAPRTWEELDDPDLRHLLFDEVLDRIDAGDPMSALGYHAGGRSAEHGPLATYIAKRTAGRTPEPVPSNALPAATGGDLPRFVIQEHHATRLHWDFRLERDGVFVSWAVPKGVPATTRRNHLAVMTEDHPLEYGSFEGEIPPGEYGAGSVTIWDDGVYDLEKWRDDEIILTVTGRPSGPLGTVRLALIRTDGAGEKSTWLMHRMKTAASGAVQEPGVEALPIDETDAGAQTEPADTPLGDLRPMLAAAATPGVATAAAERWGPWAELKWDGIRALGVWDGNTLRLRARTGTDITARYPEITAAAVGLGPDPVTLDGEIVALDDTGRPSFTLLQHRMHLTGARDIARESQRIPVEWFVFDVLAHNGTDTASLPLAERRGILDALPHPDSTILAPPVLHDVTAALDTARSLRLEGVVVKDPGAPYRRGQRSERWLKVKLTRTQEVIVGGIRPGKGGRAGSIGSLLVGIPGPDGLQYAGRVGSGFSDRTLAHLTEVLTPLRTDVDPFVGVPAADASDALWVRPEVVGEVEFAELTPAGILRHARWRGLRPDKHPDEVTPEA